MLVALPSACASPRLMAHGSRCVAPCVGRSCQNTSTTMMLMPFALGILEKVDEINPTRKAHCAMFGTAVMLGIAYGATCGGMATSIGTTPNHEEFRYPEQFRVTAKAP